MKYRGYGLRNVELGLNEIESDVKDYDVEGRSMCCTGGRVEEQ